MPDVAVVLPFEEFVKRKYGNEHLYTMPVTEHNLSLFPAPYEDASGTILVFPASECPKHIVFKEKYGVLSFEREIVNVMAYKEEDGSEIIKVRLK